MFLFNLQPFLHVLACYPHVDFTLTIFTLTLHFAVILSNSHVFASHSPSSCLHFTLILTSALRPHSCIFTLILMSAPRPHYHVCTSSSPSLSLTSSPSSSLSFTYSLRPHPPVFTTLSSALRLINTSTYPHTLTSALHPHPHVALKS